MQSQDDVRSEDNVRPQKSAGSPRRDRPHEEELAAEFIEQYRLAGEYLRSNIDALAAMATSGDDSQQARATGAIFRSLVEPLSDSFDPNSVGLYIRLMAQLIQCCRTLDAGLDSRLAAFGLVSEQDLIARADLLRPGSSPAAPADPAAHWVGNPNIIRSVIILSRVTIGADVAITSLLVQRLKQKFPAAAITLVGGVKLNQIFGGDPGLSFSELEYGRRATLVERLGAWLDLVSLVTPHIRSLDSDEYLVVDPDSRLTQLGMLPVVPASNYLLFPSREYMSTSHASLARLASDWSGQVFGFDGVQLPALAIGPDDAKAARALVGSLRDAQSCPIVSVNFGVGDNDKKRVGEDFELAILDFLLKSNAIVILDRGAGPGESSRTASLAARLARRSPESPGSLEVSESLESSESSDSLGRLEGSESSERSRRLGKQDSASRDLVISEVNEDELKAICKDGSAQIDLLILNARIGLLAAIIAASDLYIGYDSAGQHIAAAVGTPCIDIISGYSSPRMIDRWRPTGPGSATVVDAGSGRSVAEITQEVEAAALEYFKQ